MVKNNIKHKSSPKKEKTKSKTPLQQLRKLQSDPRSAKITGLFLLLVALYLLIAFSSYLFTWQEDQDKVFKFSWGLVFDSDVIIHNNLGRLGAIVSHHFFYNWFGLANFLLIPIIASWGLKFLLNTEKEILPVRLITKNGVFFILWLSVTFGYVFKNAGFAWGGGFGLSMSEWLIQFLGNVGAITFLLFILLAFMIFINFKPASITDLFTGKKVISNSSEETTATATEEPEEEDVSNFILEAKVEEPISTIDKMPLELDETNTQEEESTSEKVSDEEESLGLDIEETKEEDIQNKGIVTDNYDPTLDLPNYKYPSLELLEDRGASNISINKEELEKNKNQIVETLNNYNIKIAKIKATVGPTVTLYEIVPAPGIRISKIKNLEDDIALSLAALGIRIIAPIPGKGTIGIEVPNVNKQIVSIRSVLGSEAFQDNNMKLPFAMGKTISNEVFVADLAKMPHLLMAGATGQGKSVGLNVILVSLLYKKHPSQLKFVLVDPKKVELTLFKVIEKHFLAKLPGEEEAIITDTNKVINTLNALCIEMDTRYDLLKEARVRNIEEYNEKFTQRKLNPEKGHKYMPYIVLVVDEFADLIMTAGKEVENPIARLAQLARAIGIHLIIATQRPSVNIITGTIKANFPGRIAFKVSSKVDSRTILDMGGADQLIGRGDMILVQGSDNIRIQCAFADTPEVEKVADFIGDQQGYGEAFQLPEFSGDDTSGQNGPVDDLDEYYEEAARIIVEMQQGSTSLIQRRLKLGYNRAGRIMDQLEATGIVGPSKGSKARDVLILDIYHLEQFLQDKS